MGFDSSHYLGLFVSEATENLEALSHELAQLERFSPEQVPSAINGMFRRAHSIKGMAASLGFEPITALAHAVEDLVELFRSNVASMGQSSVDLLLCATDVLSAQVKACAEQRPPEPAESLLQKLTDQVVRLRAEGASPRAPRAAGTPPPEGAAPNGADEDSTGSSILSRSLDSSTPLEQGHGEVGAGKLLRYGIRLRLSPKCQIPGARAFLAHKRLSGLGNVFDLHPPLEELRAGQIPGGEFSFELETSAEEALVLRALNQLSEIELLGIRLERPGDSPGDSPVQKTTSPPVEPVKPLGAAEPARTVRVRTELLDYFLDAVGELLLATAGIREVGKALPEEFRPPLDEGVDRLHALTKDLHDKVMSVRMTAISVVTDRLPRVARDVSRRRGREVELSISGAEIELDRAILDELADPLLHLTRNCIDHGLEDPQEREANGKPAMGKLRLSIRREKDRVVLEMEDDGRGMDVGKLKASAVARGLVTEEAAKRLSHAEALHLCCLPGVSTAEGVSDVSGRGVGMDAVKRAVDRVGGALEIDSWPGKGTRFTLRMPLTVAVVKALLVQVGEEVVGLPISKVLGVVESEDGALTESQRQKLLPQEQGLVPVHELSTLLEFPGEFSASGPAGKRPYLLVDGEEGKMALAVDRLLGQEEVVLKALSRPLDLLPGLSGVTILGSGRPVFVLDISKLMAGA